MPRIDGHINAPPIPISALNINNIRISVASPQRIENNTKITLPIKYILLLPNISARRPPEIIKTPNTSV
ncbi:hypothetical protein GL2_31630 [Microbulbifer sp. GL-2]|nr:hypothetical protein GL2_31630 [Microbulbifer sp. GL-2]